MSITRQHNQFAKRSLKYFLFSALLKKHSDRTLDLGRNCNGWQKSCPNILLFFNDFLNRFLYPLLAIKKNVLWFIPCSIQWKFSLASEKHFSESRECKPFLCKLCPTSVEQYLFTMLHFPLGIIRCAQENKTIIHHFCNVFLL